MGGKCNIKIEELSVKSYLNSTVTNQSQATFNHLFEETSVAKKHI